MRVRVNLLELMEAMNDGREALDRLAAGHGASGAEILKALREGRWRLC